ncbi:aminotransferase class I/II-fold pyridoxal phosphate-dependent enzyme [Salinibius halmophilus]|uniref:aminotransferase class I/II-fold pyridoxal phosphate-dependent enzyme n=1 Tax=Salinibius halmophilus TaxID=1853216 RepID=UPI000E672C65|nr:aminotransferase class I/II-fold pyridoxal phosphate-dependent enzyme [Salinibius halmophilus]
MQAALHGDDIETCGFEVRYNFSSNVGPAPNVQALLQSSPLLSQYPQANKLKQKLCNKHSVAATQLLLCNGAAEAIYLLAQYFRGKHSHIITPTFCEYELACSANDHKLTYANSVQPCDVLWLCNPNNPTGKCYEPEQMMQWLTDRWLVIDESYGYQQPQLSIVGAVSDDENLVIVRSLTKELAIAGLRIGYILAPAPVIKALQRLQPPWPVNSIALHCAEQLLDQPVQACSSQWLQQQLAQIPGVTVHPSKLSYFVFTTPIAAPRLKQLLGQKFGTLVRDASNIRGCSPYCVRVCSQGQEADQYLVDSLTSTLNSLSEETVEAPVEGVLQ